MRLLIDYYAVVETKDVSKATPLRYTAFNGLKAIFSPPIDVNTQEQRGRTPLHYAAENGHEDIVALLMNAGADSAKRDEDKRTPLHCAARQGHVKAIEKLLRPLNAADRAAVLAVKDKKGWTALAYAKDDIALLLQGMK